MITSIRPASRLVVGSGVGTRVAYQANMKEAWCLATSPADRKAAEIFALYGKRSTIEETYHDA